MMTECLHDDNSLIYFISLYNQYKKNPGDGKIGVLKSFATALTRVELNETNIKNIVDDLQRLGVIDWDVTQVRKDQNMGQTMECHDCLRW